MMNDMAIGKTKKTMKDLFMDTFIFALKQADWSTGDKYVAASNPTFVGKEPHDLFDDVVEIKPDVSVYLVTASVKGDRAEGRYTLEQPKIEAPKAKKTKKAKAPKKATVAKEDIIPMEEMVEILEESQEETNNKEV